MNTKNTHIQNSQLQVKINSGLKERFRRAAEAQNPGQPKSRVMSSVVRQLVIEYVRKWEKEKEGKEEGKS